MYVVGPSDGWAETGISPESKPDGKLLLQFPILSLPVYGSLTAGIASAKVVLKNPCHLAIINNQYLQKLNIPGASLFD